MILDPILPEIYTFIDFAKHGCFTAKKRGQNSFSAHLGGDIPAEHPMPYNVYIPIREFLTDQPDAIEILIKYLETEFHKANYDFKDINIASSTCSIKKSFGRKKNYPQIDVTLTW